MSDFKINDYILNQEAEQIARCAFEDSRTYSDVDADEVLWEMVDAHEWVIYTYKAIQLCANCDVEDGELFLEDMGRCEFSSFSEHASMLAFAALLCAAREKLSEIQEEAEEA